MNGGTLISAASFESIADGASRMSDLPLREQLLALKDEILAKLNAQDFSGAQFLLGRLWRTSPGAATAAWIQRSVAPVQSDYCLRTTRIAVLRSFTVEPISQLLQAAALTERIKLEVYICPFNAYAQEILNSKSALLDFRPDLTFLCILSQSIAPDLCHQFGSLSPEQRDQTVQRVIADFQTLIRSFRERISGQLVIHTLESSDSPAMGIADASPEHGQNASIFKINQALQHESQRDPSVSLLGVDGLIRLVGANQWHDTLRWETAALPFQSEAMLAICQQWLRFVVAACGPLRKVLVCDLDNTLWNGIVGEDGADGIAMGRTSAGLPHRRLQQVILDLYHRGILLAVCSKNNWDDAWNVIQGHPDMLLRPEYFSSVRINWEPKDANLRSIAEELNIGLDSLVFLDDNPAEQSLIRQSLKEVRVLDAGTQAADYADLVLNEVGFERLRVTEEDRQRGQMYSAQRQRTEASRAAGNLESWLESLETVVCSVPVTTVTLNRIAQLTQKTNQFNLTNRRYSVSDLQRMHASENWRILGFQVSDRFGDNGIVGVVILHREENELELDTFLMSCRVIGRGIEQTMLANVGEFARLSGVISIKGDFVKTPRNSLCDDFLERHGFHFDGSRWKLDFPAFHALKTPKWNRMQQDFVLEPKVDGTVK